MNIFLTFLFMIIIGALIGGITNYLAIKMLFRPYEAIYLGKWRLPFTPGLIPRRREELALQLGELVVNYLVTEQGLEQKLLSQSFMKQVQPGLEKYIREFLQNKQWKQWLRTVMEKHGTSFKQKLSARSVNMAADALKSGRTLREILPEHLDAKAEPLIRQLSLEITDQILDYLKSEEGMIHITGKVNEYLSNKGMFGNMMGMFFGGQNMMQKLYPELVRFVEDADLQLIISGLLEKEYERLKSEPLHVLDERFHLASGIKQIIDHLMDKVEPAEVVPNLADELMDEVFQKQIISEWLPYILKNTIVKLAPQVGKMLSALDLKAVVSDQVRAFSVEKLETLVLSISKREFKMITWLGALLGGLVGVIQGVIVILLA